jgi:UrcA family protein
MIDMRSLYSNAMIAVASVVAASGLVAFADPANADVPAVPQVAVQIADLDLASPHGRVTAERRIYAAVDQVCDQNGDDGDPLGPYAQCREQAITRAKAALGTKIASR